MADLIKFALLLLLLVAVGCSKPTTQTSPNNAAAQEPIEESDSISPNDPRKRIAAKAKDALFAKLSGRLKEVLSSEGPAAAIDVCSQQATTIANTVGTEHGVAIGRTSFKLRNAANAPRGWAETFVHDRVDTPQHVLLDDGSLGALFPIRLDVKCLMCHGQADEILDDVKPKLAALYPDDAATGFKQGDLRGWFWVEVPAQ